VLQVLGVKVTVAGETITLLVSELVTVSTTFETGNELRVTIKVSVVPDSVTETAFFDFVNPAGSVTDPLPNTLIGTVTLPIFAYSAEELALFTDNVTVLVRVPPRVLLSSPVTVSV
jgi:hypothetical protein